MASLAYALSGAEGLYDEGLPVIRGKLPPEARLVVTQADEHAEGMVSRLLRKYGIGHRTPEVPYVIDHTVDTEKSGVMGYTNGRMIGLPPEIIPENSFFYKFTRKLSESDNPLMRYMKRKLSKPVANLIETIVHEKLHVATQFRERYDKDGTRTNFLSDLYGATTQYFKEKLPRSLQPFSEYLARNVFIPMVEGLNQAATYEALGMEGNKQIKQAAAKVPTSYARLTELAASSLDEVGKDSPGQFYREYFRNGYREAKEYVSGFFKTLGRYMSAQQPQAAYAYATA